MNTRFILITKASPFNFRKEMEWGRLEPGDSVEPVNGLECSVSLIRNILEENKVWVELRLDNHMVDADNTPGLLAQMIRQGWETP